MRCREWNKLERGGVYGIDLSLSRILYARQFAKRKGVDIKLSVANMFELPFGDSSIDLVFTSHCIEPNTGREKEALRELYRVARKYVVMVEPSYDLGNEGTKKRIEEHCYIKSLRQAAGELNYEIIEHRLFEVTTYNNNSALMIIKKGVSDGDKIANPPYTCPICGDALVRYKDCYYCSDCFLVYPIINGIPVFHKKNAILCSKFKNMTLSYNSIVGVNTR